MAAKRQAGKARGRESLKGLCRGMAGATEDIKWRDHLVFSVGGRMFAMFDARERDDDPAPERGSPGAVRFPCDDDDFARLVETPGVIPSPYMTHLGWVRVERSAKIPIAELRRLLTKAHGLVLARLPRRTREGILGGAPVTKR